jgi:hypothetical protein
MVLSFTEFQRVFETASPYAKKDLVRRARVVITVEPVEGCQQCGQIPLIVWRADKRYCSKACKQKAYRVRKVKV